MMPDSWVLPNDGANHMAKKAKKKPKGWRAFDALARRVAQVPKEEVDKKIKRDKAKRKKAKRKK